MHDDALAVTAWAHSEQVCQASHIKGVWCGHMGMHQRPRGGGQLNYTNKATRTHEIKKQDLTQLATELILQGVSLLRVFRVTI